MLQNSAAYSSMSCPDTAQARAFYEGVLGLTVTDEAMEGIIKVTLPLGGAVMMYPKDNHVPATFTVLNFPVDDIDAAVDELVSRGVTFERYDGFPQDDKGIMRGKETGHGPDQAWFTDPGGNILSVLTD